MRKVRTGALAMVLAVLLSLAGATAAQAAPAGWQKQEGNWKYTQDDGSYATGWLKDGNAWYYLDEEGVMQTGWQEVANKRGVMLRYYMAPNGAMVKGWKKLSGAWYYFAHSGQMLTGWQKVKGNTYYLGAGGQMQTGWIQGEDGAWYYLRSTGAMARGWQAEGGKMYYLSSSGRMLAGTSVGQTALGGGGAAAGSYVQHGKTLDPNKPMIALTFDDGPGPGTARILKALDKVGGRATFFVVGSRARSYPALMKQIVAQGSEVGNHTYSHPNLTKMGKAGVRSQLTRTSDAANATSGTRTIVMRPPGGAYNSSVKSACAELGYPIIMWSVDTLDWRTRNATKTYNSILSAKNGSIVLMHDLYVPTAEAAERAIPKLAARGYQLVTVSELLTSGNGGMMPGQVYTKK